jgi:hypothetical protein
MEFQKLPVWRHYLSHRRVLDDWRNGSLEKRVYPSQLGPLGTAVFFLAGHHVRA